MAKEVNKKINIWLNQQGIDNNLKSIRAEINKTANELAKLPIGSEEWLQKSKKLSDLKRIYSELQKEIGTTSRELDALNKRNMDQIITIGALSSAVQTASAAVRRFASATQEYVEAYAKMDDAMTNVSKYTGLTREEVKQLNDEFREMDTRTATEKLNALAADAGRLGITSKEAIKDFVEAADIINVALGEDLGEDAVKNIGKMAQMFGESDRMGLRGAMLATASAVNTLAQSSSASEPYIMEVSSRLAGVANAAGMTQAQIMGLASALDQNMAQAEKSATALQKFILGMTSATDKYAEIAGMTVDEFRQVMEQDMNQALVSVIDGFKRIQDTGGISALNESLDELKLKGSGIKETLTSLVMHTDQLKEAQQLATQAYADGNSVIDEAAAVNGNAAAQLEKAKKKMQDMKAELGNKLIPIITQLSKIGADGLKVLSSIITFVEQHKVLVSAMLVLTLKYYATKHKEFLLEVRRQALEKAGIILAKAKNAILATSTTFTQLFALAKAKLTKNTLAAANAQKALKAAFASTPWGAIITAVIALVDVFKRLSSAAFTAEGRIAAFYQKYKNEAEVTYKKEEDRINSLIGIIESETASRDNKLKAIKKLQEVMPDYTASLDDEGRLLSQNKKAIDDYLKSFKQMATLKGAQAAYEDAEAKYQAKQAEWEAERKNYQDSNWAMKAILQGKRWLLDAGGEYIGRQFFGLDFGPGMTDVQAHDLKETRDALLKNYEDLAKEYEEVHQKMLLDGEGESTCTGDPKTCMCADCVQKREDDAAKWKAEQEKKLKEQEAFRKKMAEMEHKDSVAALNDWERIKAEIHEKHQDLITESKQLFGENNEYIQKIKEMEAQAISAAADKYLQKSKDFATKFSEEIGKLAQDSAFNNSPQSRLVTAIAGSDQQWNKVIATARENAKELENILDEMDPNAEEWNDFAADLAKAQDDICKAEEMQAQARINITKKFVEEEGKALAKREKEQNRQIALNKEGLTEEQKSAMQRQWKIEDLNDEYDAEIKLMEAALAAKIALNDGDTESIAKIEQMIAKLKDLKANVEATVEAGSQNKKKRTGNSLVDLVLGNIDDPRERFQAMTDVLQEFADRAINIYQQIADAQQQSAELELQRFNEAQDAKATKLQQQLNDGLISQKYYDAQMEKMEAEREKKEKRLKHDQFEKEKTASIIQATIAGALAVMQGFAQLGPIGGAIAAAVTAATTAIQIAIIASQANPYAKGGFIRKKQLAIMGEEGQEWVASNRLVEGKETAPVIAALEEYQRGNHAALQRLATPTVPAWKTVSQSASDISSNFAASRTPVSQHYYHSSLDELLNEMKRMNKFLSDPENRRAYLSQRLQDETTKNREFIKQVAKI